MLVKRIHTILILILCNLAVNAQIQGFYNGKIIDFDTDEFNRPEKNSTQLSFYLCQSNYLGDLGGNYGIGKKFIHDNNLKKRTSFYGVSISHMRFESLGYRISYISGSIAGSDQDVSYKNTNDFSYFRYKRNLDFKSKISEFSVLIEAYPLKFLNFKNNLHHLGVQPYLLLGLGVFHFNPQGSYFDEIAEDYVWVDLAPLSTEGQGMNEYPNSKHYKLTQTNIPFGAGLKFELGKKTSLSFEFVGRKLHTDYLDDVSTNYIDPNLFAKYLQEEDAEIAKIINNKSNIIDPDSPYSKGEQRGNSKHKDFYYSFNLKFSMEISKLKIPSWKKQIKYDDNEICY